MLRLRDKGRGIPGGFQYHQSETDTVIHGPHWWGLVDSVLAHRRANKLRVPVMFEDEIESQVALRVHQVAPDLVFDEDAQIVHRYVPQPRRWNWNDVLQFTATIGDSVLHGSPRVGPEIAAERAAVCAGCQYNVAIAGCAGCGTNAIASLIGRLAAGTTPSDGALKACEFCGCFNKAAVWFPVDLLQRHMTPEVMESLPDFCWKKPQKTL
jgi:hypothetical protein